MFYTFAKSCILSKFYIKPQPGDCSSPVGFCCILSKFYIKPQQNDQAFKRMYRCILSKFYIKPQQCRSSQSFLMVVSYRNSTSNHNTPAAVLGSSGLYLIEILHQTTTIDSEIDRSKCCILSKFYIKPQLVFIPFPPIRCCILSKFYIKPQRKVRTNELDMVVSYRNSTSNHNGRVRTNELDTVVSYRNSTSNHNTLTLRSVSITVVSYRNSTSNHNNSVLLVFRM